MTRIIAGIAGSRQLAAPASPTRPTSDRIRESIFNRLENWDAISEVRVLDLFAGTGALALEAVSRGAASAVLVEKDAKAAAVCSRNVATIQDSLNKAKLTASIRVVSKSVESYLASLAETFDLVFIDPPYEFSNTGITEILANLAPRLSADAVVMVERSSRSGEFEIPSALELESTKDYGDTTVFWLLPKERD